MVLMSRTTDSNFHSGDIESIQVHDHIATAGSFVVKLCNINDVDTYGMASVCGTLKCENAAICEKVAKCEQYSTPNVKIDAICEKITLNVKK